MSSSKGAGRAVRVVEVAGPSMEPGIPRGRRVLIDRRSTEPEPGDVALIQGAGGPVLHRILATYGHGGQQLVFHRGDAGGGIGRCPHTAVVGIAVGFVDGASSFPTLESMGRRPRRSFRSARIRALLLARLLRISGGPGLRRLPFRSVGVRLSALLLQG